MCVSRFKISSLAKKRKILTIETIQQILFDVDKKLLSKKQIAEKYGIPHNSLSMIIKNQEKIKPSNQEPNRKILRLATNANIDKAMLTWFKQARSINAPTSGPIICEQAKIIADKLGLADFHASNRWLEKFKQRHGIVFRVACVESVAVDTDIVNEWKKAKLANLITKYSPDDIFNVDETGSFFHCLPNKTKKKTTDPPSPPKNPKNKTFLMRP